MSWAFRGPLVSLGSCGEGKEGLLPLGVRVHCRDHTHTVTQPWVDGLRVCRRKGGWS